MPRHLLIRLILVALALPLLGSRASANQFVLLDYNLSVSRFRDTVFIELFDDRPLSRDNFLQYVDTGKYDASLMHRLARNFVLQGGGFLPVLVTEPNPSVAISLDPNARVDLDGNPATPNPAVNNEYNNIPVRSNLVGTLAMAKVGGNPNSATSEFFFNLGNNSANLDVQNGGFTVFAQVAGDGMSLINAFNNLSLVNLNPDADDNGVREAGPFASATNPSSDAVPVSQAGSLLVLQDAQRVNYWGAAPVNVPAGGLTISGLDTFIDTGATFTGTGSITIGAGRTLGVREAVAITRPLINQGTLAPGMRLGSITTQQYQQTASGTLDIQITGTTADTTYDRLVVSGAAQLGGRLLVTLASSFSPVSGNSFAILTANSITGSFNDVDLPLLSEGRVWDFNLTSTSLTLTVAVADYNRDGVVDAADYTVWRNTRGSTVTAFSGADGNGDTIVNQQDYIVWRDNYGNTAGGSGPGAGAAAGVPEPATFSLFLAAICCLVLRRRR